MTRPVSVRSSYSRHAAAFDAVAALALSTLALLAGWWAHAFARVGAVFRAAGELDQAVFAAIVLCVAAVMFGTRRWLEQRRAHAALGASEDEARSLLVRTAESAAELRERERRLRLVTDQLPAVVWTTSPDLVFTSAMGSGLRATGVDVHDCVGLPLAELLGADPENAALAAHRRSLEGEAVTYSLTFGGRTFAAHTEPLTDESGARIGVIGVALDETERTTAEAQYRRLVESSPYGIYVTDAQRRFVQANAAMSGILGRPVEALAGKGVEEVVAAADLETLRDVIARRESGESTPIGIEIHVVRPGGEQRRVHVTSTLVFDEQGALACTFGMVRDVTEERAAERRLAELSAALAAAVEGIARMDAEGRLVSANPAYAAAFGCAPHELAGTRCDGRVHPGDLPALREAYARMRREGRGELACRGVRADGTTFHLHTVLVAQHDESGAFTGHHSFLRDVTEKARADEALRFQAHLLQCVQQAVIATDAGGRITHWNRSAEALYGWRADEVLGRPVSEVVPAEGTGEAGEIPARMASGESWHGDFRVRRRDGSAFLAEVTGSPVHDAGRLAGAVCVSSDVTGRRRLEEQLRQVQKMEAVGQLAGGVAHDFNNLLTAINGYADLAAEEVPPGSAAREYAAEIRAAGGRAAGLTRQLLAFSRRQVLEPRLVELNAVAGGLEKMLRRVISEDVELVFRLDPGATPVFADPGQLDQVLLNLAVNARDAMPRGGRMVIETEAVELSQAAAETHPSGLPAGRYVALRVADDGEGMDAETLPRIFEPFFTTKGKERGTGLGLATVHGIVQQSGGRVWAESAPGEGATVHVWLPRAQAEDDAPRTERPAPAAAGGRETILLVEDDEAVRALCTRMLRRQGYRVVAAAGGADAEAEARRRPGAIQLLLTDVVMPGMSGADLAARLSARHPSLRVLLMSGYPGDALAKRGVHGERLELIAKPFSAERLAARVREVLDAT